MLWFVTGIERLLIRLGVLSGFATLLIMVIICIDVVGRAFFNSPMHSGVELSELLLVSLVFFGLAAAQQQRQNFALEIATRHLPMRVQVIVELVGYVACLMIVILLAWPSTIQAITSIERGESGFGIVAFPVWPARIVLAAGLWLLALQFLCDIYRLTTGQTREITRSSASEGSIE